MENINPNRKRAMLAKKKRRRKKIITIAVLAVLVAVLVIIGIVFLVKALGTGGSKQKATDTAAESVSESALESETESGGVVTGGYYTPDKTYNVDANTPSNYEVEPQWTSILEDTGDDLLNQANYLAAEYDYDSAMALLQASENYSSSQAYQDAVAEYQQKKSELVKWADNTQITHIFFHTLVVDVDTAFSSYKTTAYNEVMTTVTEFCDIMQQMYDRGYVLVSIYDVAKMETQEDGTEKMVFQDIYLPEGKTPFVLSQDDVSYYEYMTGTGFASRFVIGEDGRITNEMDLADGTTLTGSYDLVPILEDFIETHPDFCYKGARGTLAMTGYDGLFGYRTSDFWYNTDCDYFIANEKNLAERENEHTSPNLNIEQDKITATEIANQLKAQGWTFASHSWGHRKYGEIDISAMEWDADIWEKEVEPILGETDILIFPTGNDIGSWRGYEDTNERYQYLKSLGFDYFCNVDSSVVWVQRTDNYLRQGRRNVDGTRMWQALEGNDMLSDLFDVASVFDSARPTPVE